MEVRRVTPDEWEALHDWCSTWAANPAESDTRATVLSALTIRELELR